MHPLLTASNLADALSLIDLTDPRHGQHAMQILLCDLTTRLVKRWRCRAQTVRGSPVVQLENNYDRLGYPSDGAARDARYTRYVCEKLILRTQTSSAIPDLLAGLSIDPPDDLLLIIPGLVYRRDSIDRLHCAEPHQLDLWRVVGQRSTSAMTVADLEQMIGIVMQVALPGIEWKMSRSLHPYTENGVQIDVRWQDEWIEVGECGLTARTVLDNAGLDEHSGLAMGLGLDRLLMVRKNIPDIRLLRSQDPRIKNQMHDLAPYKPVSLMPPSYRDLSLCMKQSANEEEIGDRIRNQLPEIDCVESVSIKAETPYSGVPQAAVRRMGMRPGQKNILLRITIRHMSRTVSDEEANDIRNKVYRLLHQGKRLELALSSH